MIRKYVLSAMSICLCFIFMVLLLIGIIKVELLEGMRVLFLCLGFVGMTIGLLFAYFSKSKNIYNIGVFVSILINLVLGFYVVELNNKFDYVKDMFKNEYKYVNYNVYVQRKTTTYSDITRLEGRKAGVLFGEVAEVQDSLKKVVNLECRAYNSMDEIEYAILNGEIQSFILSDEKIREVHGEENKIMNKVRIIYTDKYKDS